MSQQLLNCEEAAAIIGISKRHWYRLVSEGAAPAPVRLGRCVRWRQADLDEWIKNLGTEKPNETQKV
jgi:prophage regulatory protein